MKLRKTKRTLFWGGILSVGMAAAGATGLAQGTQGEVKVAPEMIRRAEELKSLKWGMFVCWSFSTFSGKEWSPGITNVDFFAAKEMDTDQWARTAKEAEMGYILFLTKHVDGFCLWDTRTTDRKVTRAPLGRDVLAEVRKSCDKYGLKLALYFCEGDLSWPGAKGSTSGKDADKERAQLTELLTRYGPIEFMWVDHAAGLGGLSHQEILEHCRKLQPGCLVGFNHGDQTNCYIRVCECGRPGPVNSAANGFNKGGSQHYLVSEFTYPIQPHRPKGAMWFYSHPDNEDACQPWERLYEHYCGGVKFGNIFSIDVGPDYRGRLRRIDVETLRRVGQEIRDFPRPLPPSLATGKPITASSLWQFGEEHVPGKASDGDAVTRWSANLKETTSGWLEVDLLKEQIVDAALIMEKSFPRTEAFAIEVKKGDRWKKIVEGTTLGSEKRITFKPVKARYVRLNLIKTKGTPSIEEFQLYERK
jgi:alpha-L-fucosidase